MYILSFGTMISKIFRLIFFFLDNVVYNLIPKIYDLLITIARTSPLSQASITDMASRIYKLLAVFMIFKVTFSLIMYVVNPDDFSDKSKGVSKLVTNIVISLALLVLTPYLFSYGFQFQKLILEDNSLATLIFGDDAANTNNALSSAGDSMAYIAITPFITPNLTLFDCTKLYDVVDDEIVLNESCFGFTDLVEYDEGKIDCNGNKYSEALCGHVVDDDDSKLSKEDLLTYAAGIKSGNFNLMFRKELISTFDKEDDEKFMFDYTFFISTAVGIVILLFMITICMDVALRSIKLAFLQLIAPIPILSYIDPKSGKDGMFKKWYQMCLKTYLSLFIKLLVIYFAIYIISNIGYGKMVDVIDGSYITNGLVKIFIIIGALMFAKDFTKILESLGVKLDGGFQLNPIKKFEEQALGGKRITGAVSGATVGALGGISQLPLVGRNIKNNWKKDVENGKGRLYRTLHAGFGAVTGTLGTGIEPVKGLLGGGIHNEGFTKGWKSQVSANRKMRDAMANGSTWVGRRLENIGDLTGMTIPGTSEATETKIHQVDEEIKAIDNKIANLDNLMAPNKKKADELKLYADAVSAMEKRAVTKIENGEAGVLSTMYQKKQAHIESLKARLDEQTRSGASRTVLDAIETEIAAAVNDSKNFLNDVAMKGYISANRGGDASIQETAYNSATGQFEAVPGGPTAISAGKIFGVDSSGNAKHDGTLENQTKTMEQVVTDYGKDYSEMDSTFSGEALHAALGAAKESIGYYERQNSEYERDKRGYNTEKTEKNDKKAKLYEEQKARKANRDVTSGK